MEQRTQLLLLRFVYSWLHVWQTLVWLQVKQLLILQATQVGGWEASLKTVYPDRQILQTLF